MSARRRPRARSRGWLFAAWLGFAAFGVACVPYVRPHSEHRGLVRHGHAHPHVHPHHHAPHHHHPHPNPHPPGKRHHHPPKAP